MTTHIGSALIASRAYRISYQVLFFRFGIQSIKELINEMRVPIA